MVKLITILSLFLFLHSFTKAQVANIDSLARSLLKVRDTSKVKTLLEIGSAYKEQDNYEEALATRKLSCYRNKPNCRQPCEMRWQLGRS